MQVEATATALVWVKESPGFFRSGDGRYDVFFSAAVDAWVAVDWEAAKKHRAANYADAVRWCERQAGGRT